MGFLPTECFSFPFSYLTSFPDFVPLPIPPVVYCAFYPFFAHPPRFCLWDFVILASLSLALMEFMSFRINCRPQLSSYLASSR